MISYGRMKPGPGFRPMRAALYYSQRLTTHPAVRRFVASNIAAVVNLLHPAASSTDATAEAAAVSDCSVALLTRDGYAVLDNLLSESALDDIAMFLGDREVVGKSNHLCRVDQLPTGTRTAAYPLTTVMKCPHILDLLNNPAVLRIATGYLRCKPTISSIGIRWSFPATGAGEDTQHFHRDPDDWRFLKLLVYLTDVGPRTGPHMYVTGSHKTAGRVRERPYTTDEIVGHYGPECVRVFTGPRGTSFVANTYGIHKGAVPTAGPRLILQVQYSLLPVFALRYEPVAVKARPALDRYVNRLLVA